MLGNFDGQELGGLITEMLLGSIGNEDFVRLREMLGKDPDAMRYYIEFITLWSLLDRENEPVAAGQNADISEIHSDVWQALAESEKTAETVEITKPTDKSAGNKPEISKEKSSPKKVPTLSLYTAAASTAALLFIMVFILVMPERKPVVATVTDTIDAKWADPGLSLSNETEMRAGPATLLEGFVQLTLDDGANVILHAPCAVDLESPNQIFLSRGRISAKVPRGALGFTVRTPGAKVVDYGTEFGVIVDETGCTEAHVFKGAVELYAQNKSDRRGGVLRMYENNAGRADVRGNLSMIDIRRTDFVEYIAFSLKKGLVAYWPFDGDALDYSGCGKDGVETGGGQYATGRIGQAFDFSVYGRYVHIGAADIAVPWTMAAWVKRHSSGSEIPLMISQDYNIRLQQWGNSDGKVGITAIGVGNYTFNYVCPLGEWVHLVLAGSKTGTSLYVNGVPVDSIPEKIPCPMTSIGRPTPIAASVDEVAVWNRKLTEAEIQYIYKFGLSSVQQRQE